MPVRKYEDYGDAVAQDYVAMGGNDPFIRPSEHSEVIKTIASRYNLTPKTVRTWLQRDDLLHKKRTVWPNDIIQLVLSLNAEGRRSKDIANELRGMRESEVSDILERYGRDAAGNTFRKKRRRKRKKEN